MKRRKSSTQEGRAYWITEMPELKEEIVQLFGEAGVVKLTEATRHYCDAVGFDIELKQPVRLWHSGSGEAGFSMNSTTCACMHGGFQMFVEPLPKEGATTLHCEIFLQMDTFQNNKRFSLKDGRCELQQMANKMLKPWYLI